MKLHCNNEMLAITEDSKFSVVFCAFLWYFSFSFVRITTSGTFSSLGGWEEVWITINEGKRKKNEMPGETAVFLLGCCDFSSLLRTASKATKLQLISRNQWKVGTWHILYDHGLHLLVLEKTIFQSLHEDHLNKSPQGFSGKLLLY